MTPGQLMFYGGIGVTALGIVMVILCIPLFAAQRRKMEKMIKEDYLS